MKRLVTIAGRLIAFALLSALLASCGGAGAPGSGDTAGGDDADGPGAGDARTGRDAQRPGGADAPAPPSPPSLRSATARVSGAAGYDVVIDVLGDDEGGDVVLVHLRLETANGAPVNAWSLSTDGSEGTNVAALPLDEDLRGETSFIGAVTLARLARDYPEVAVIAVAVEDSRGELSEELRATVTEQVVQELGAACDPEYRESRCEPGYGCYGEPPSCVEGVAPEITRAAYVRTELGARILLAGTEPEDDLAVVELAFLDRQGNPVVVDLDNDEMPESERFEVEAEDQAWRGEFFLALESTETFALQVERIAATPRDMAGHQGATKTLSLANQTVRSNGSSCDPRGFDVCAAGLACTPGDPSVRNTCQRLQSLQPRMCDTAPVLDPVAGDTRIAGSTSTVSLWDAPPVCSAGDPVGRPEGLVLLRLTAAASRLTLSTEGTGTNFDTVLYVLDGCAETSAAALGCSDDTEQGAAAVLTLEMVPAGDYLVVVDSWGADGGDFVLTVTME